VPPTDARSTARAQFLSESAPLCIKETKVEAMTGRTLAIDASMCMYQFLVAVRQGDSHANLSNAAGDVTSHIQGFLSRTVRLLEAGVKPVFVFDGKPPELKRQTLAGRAEKKAEADADLAAALESGDSEEIRKAAHRTARATPQMNADVQDLLRLLGCPVVLAPSEAEASCAALCRAGVVYATATEDMDALTFGSVVVLKNLFDTESSRTGTKRPVFEIRLATMLEQLDVPMDAFVDFCILCGCDYCGTLRGVGPATAFKLIKTHGSIEAALATIDASKVPPAEDWRFEEARRFFQAPEVVQATSVELAWRAPDYAALTDFLVSRHSFNDARVARVIERLKACRSAGQQMRLDSFFRVGGPKAVPANAKFDPFKKKGGASSSAGKRPIGGGKAKDAKKPRK
jgi:flap endonuclease-1